MGLMGKGVIMFFLVIALVLDTTSAIKVHLVGDVSVGIGISVNYTQPATTSDAKVHHVGDLFGWIGIGVNYTQWAESRTFHYGDKLVFEYDNVLSSVVQVNKDDFEQCKVSNKPIAAYNTGKDTILITAKKGDYYFISDTFFSCQLGQKLHIRIVPDHDDTVSAQPLKSLSQHHHHPHHHHHHHHHHRVHRGHGNAVPPKPSNSPSPHQRPKPINAHHDSAAPSRPLNSPSPRHQNARGNGVPPSPAVRLPLNPSPSPVASLPTPTPESSNGLVGKGFGVGIGGFIRLKDSTYLIRSALTNTRPAP